MRDVTVANKTDVYRPGPICNKIPYIKNYYDTVLIEKAKGDSTFNYKSLNHHEIANIFDADAVIIGKVIAKRFSRDTLKCLHFKTEIIIEVQHIIHSYFNLKINDKVFVKTHWFGYNGGCLKGHGNVNGANTFMYGPDATTYKLGHIKIFSLNREYYNCFMKGTVKTYNNKDIYCPQVFYPQAWDFWLMNNNINDTALVQKLNDFKDFFEHEYKKK